MRFIFGRGWVSSLALSVAAFGLTCAISSGPLTSTSSLLALLELLINLLLFELALVCLKKLMEYTSAHNQ